VFRYTCCRGERGPAVLLPALAIFGLGSFFEPDFESEGDAMDDYDFGEVENVGVVKKKVSAGPSVSACV